MNALNPPVSVLRKLALFLISHPPYSMGLAGLREWPETPDPEILEWLDRMAFLEYVPNRPPPKFKNINFAASPLEASAIVIPPGQVAGLSLLDAQPDKIECGVVIAEIPKRKLFGFQIWAKNKNGLEIATFHYAPNNHAAMKLCLDEFPLEEEYVGHSVRCVTKGMEEGDRLGGMLVAATNTSNTAEPLPEQTETTIMGLSLEDL